MGNTRSDFVAATLLFSAALVANCQAQTPGNASEGKRIQVLRIVEVGSVQATSVKRSRACSAQAELMGFDGIHGAFWIGDSTGIDSPLGGGRCRRPILLIFEVG